MRQVLSNNRLSNSVSFSFYCLIGLAALGVFLSSCAGDTIQQDRISGKWVVVKAARNGKETKTLEDGYFDFTNDTLFQTNIFSREETFPYVLSDERIYQQGGENVVYTIVPSEEDSLILHTTIRNFDFEFIAVRDTAEAPVQEHE